MTKRHERAAYPGVDALEKRNLLSGGASAACASVTAWLGLHAAPAEFPPARPGNLMGAAPRAALSVTAAAAAIFRRVPNPLSATNPVYPLVSQPAPAPGGSFLDPNLGTRQTRVTSTLGLRHEYSRFDPFNKDQSLILLFYPPQGEYRVYRTAKIPFDAPGNRVATVNLAEPRWDRTNPNLLWGTDGFRLVTLNPLTSQRTVIKDFAKDPKISPILRAEPDLYNITMKDEGEPSLDNRYWVFEMQGTTQDYRPRYLFTWDSQTNQILGLIKLAPGESNIDWVGMSPKGTYVLIGGDADNGRFTGLTMANLSLTWFHQINPNTGHADVGLDAQGREVIVMQNSLTDYVDMILIQPSTGPVPASGNYAGTGHVPLVRLYYNNDSPVGFASGIHISCNYPGYAVISTSTEPGAPAKNWLDRSIIVVKLNAARPTACYLAKVYGIRDAYWEETHASITNDGSRVIWATNWGQNVDQEKVFLMQLLMPKGWEASLS